MSFLPSSWLRRSRVLWVLYLIEAFNWCGKRTDAVWRAHIFAARDMETRMSTPRDERSLSHSCNGRTLDGRAMPGSDGFGGMAYALRAVQAYVEGSFQNLARIDRPDENKGRCGFCYSSHFPLHLVRYLIFLQGLLETSFRQPAPTALPTTISACTRLHPKPCRGSGNCPHPL